jgi:hypothetical membrane protein
MSEKLSRVGCISGMVIPFWLLIGVVIAGSMYPGYSHFEQALSELGAAGSPTHLISPFINNFPLGILFILFGVSSISFSENSRLAGFTGILIATHGVASISAGLFSCDVGCNPKSPSMSQIIHNISGLIMFLTLVVSSGVWMYLGKRLYESKRVAWFSFLCTLIAVMALLPMVMAVQSGTGFGLYQRINYGASVVWVGGLAYEMYKRSPIQNN